MCACVFEVMLLLPYVSGGCIFVPLLMIPVLPERIFVCLVLQFGCVVVVLFITYIFFRLLMLLGAVM